MSERGRKCKAKSRTEQSHAKMCNINVILERAMRTGTVTHLNKYGAMYGDFADFDYEEACIKIAEAKSMFQELPSEVRKEFENDPKKFLDFVNDPENKDDLAEKLPALAAPGRQMPDVVGNRLDGFVDRLEKILPGEPKGDQEPSGDV